MTCFTLGCRIGALVLCNLLLAVTARPVHAHDPVLDLTRATVHTLGGGESCTAAREFLVAEIEKRIQQPWGKDEAGSHGACRILLATMEPGRITREHLGLPPDFAPNGEGYYIYTNYASLPREQKSLTRGTIREITQYGQFGSRIWASSEWQQRFGHPFGQGGGFGGNLYNLPPFRPAPRVNQLFIFGTDERGVLFGVGHLLRAMSMQKGQATLPASFRAASSPKYPIRGHQLGYRPKTNSYDAWTLPMWEQYIRDLIVFGCNAVELIPPRSDDAATSPHFPLPPMDMMVGMSSLLARYGLDVWVWYPAMDKDYSNPKTVEFALKEWGDVFKKLPKVDAIFVPGGDPGHTQPKHLMALLEKQTENLHRYHPKAQMWVSPQSFDKTWMDEFLDILKTEPQWLTGIVHGPQVRMTLADLRSKVPARYKIRQYPDITHSLRSQYPVPDWDAAFGITHGREPINPRPLDQAAIFRGTQPHTNGFITYSEGCNDDVNKMVWSALGWNPDAEVTEVLRDYGRYFIGADYADRFAHGLLALERNWQGPALTNRGIETTLQQFQDMERTASPQLKLNWRFQQALYRAYYDAYVRSRLIYETHLEDDAMAALRAARTTGSPLAMTRAEAILDQAVTRPVATDLRARAFELAEALFQSIRMQSSVPRYQAISVGRGATLDTVDAPLNNRLWLKERFTETRKLPTEAERQRLLNALVNWTNPGPGGYYDDLGDPANQPHLVRGKEYAKDPAFFESPITFLEDRPVGRKSWWNQALALYDAPLLMHYKGLDPSATYKLRVVYGAGPIRLVADEKIEIHPSMTQRFTPVEFDVPQSATQKGELKLSWFGPPGAGGAGRGCQVAEVWLIQK